MWKTIMAIIVILFFIVSAGAAIYKISTKQEEINKENKVNNITMDSDPELVKEKIKNDTKAPNNLIIR